MMVGRVGLCAVLILFICALCSACGTSFADFDRNSVTEKRADTVHMNYSESYSRKSSSFSLDKPPSLRDLASGEVVPPKPEELGYELREAGEQWFFGYGFGRTMLNVGTIVVFPAYALYLLGNAVLQLCGYDGLYVTNILPSKIREPVMQVYDGVTYAPGKVNSFIFEHEFYNEP